MLFRQATLEGIAAGTIDTAFRRWARPRVRVGTRQRTAVGLVEITAVERVPQARVTAAEARRAGASSRAALLAELGPADKGPIWRLRLAHAGVDPRIALRARSRLTAAERDELLARLARLDRASRRGPWTRQVLALIADQPAVRAPDLAARLGRETQPFKRDVRKLKELGLTESLEVGYRLSPRGRTVLGLLEDEG